MALMKYDLKLEFIIKQGNAITDEIWSDNGYLWLCFDSQLKLPLVSQMDSRQWPGPTTRQYDARESPGAKI